MCVCVTRGLGGERGEGRGQGRWGRVGGDGVCVGWRRGGEILKFLNTRCRVIYSEIVNGAALKTKSKALVR